eukprot:2412406-Alexandrium_andersonii.AAC.1
MLHCMRCLSAPGRCMHNRVAALQIQEREGEWGRGLEGPKAPAALHAPTNAHGPRAPALYFH